MAKTNQRRAARGRRKAHIKKKIRGTTERPRLSVFRSASHIYAQIIDDTTGRTLASASTLDGDVKHDGSKGNVEAAKKVGALIGARGKKAGLTKVCFDRNGYLYHGRVKALADAARESGLEF